MNTHQSPKVETSNEMSEALAIQQLLCSLVMPNVKKEQYASIESCETLKLIELANTNFMNFALYWGLQSKGLLQLFTEQEKGYLKDYYELNKQRNLSFIRELHDVISELNKLSIEPVLLKGAVALLDGWYEDIGERFLRDVDFLVPEDKAQQAFELLQGLGYQIVNPLDEKLHELETHQLAALSKEGSSLVIEIHMSPVNLKAKDLLNPKEVFNHKRQVIPSQFDVFGCAGNGDVKCYLPSPEHCLLIAVIHTQIADSNYEKGIFFLRHGMDVQRIIARYNLHDYQTINALFAANGFGDLFKDYKEVLDLFFSIKNTQTFSDSNSYADEVVKYIEKTNSFNKTNKKHLKQKFFFKKLTNAFSKERIAMRYGVSDNRSVLFYRIVNFSRLIMKYASPTNRDNFSVYMDESLDTKTFLDKKGGKR